MRIGMVCPYSFDEPGGVQIHVLDLARALRNRGHDVRVLAPGTAGTEPEEFVTLAGPGVGIPYNGSVARLSFGPRAWLATRKWLRAAPLDVLHIHEPNPPSVGLAALALSQGPIAATFHTSATSSLVLRMADGILAPMLEKIRGRIAVSPLARRWQIEALGSDAVEIPNGVDVSFYRRFAATVADDGTHSDTDAHTETPTEETPTDSHPRADSDHPSAPPRPLGDPPTVTFLGRYDEPRKGMDVLAAALPAVLRRVPDLRLRIMGSGDERALRARLPRELDVEFLGRVDDAEKARALAAGDVYCAPNTGGESFGIVLVEAMAAGTAVVASDLDAFRRVLRDGTCGELFPVEAPAMLAAALVRVLTDHEQRARLVDEAARIVWEYDWDVVTERVLRVYETIRHPGEVLGVR